MTDKKVLTIQDISCMGQCSLTVALPIISACGVETIILPSAVLSTHTGGKLQQSKSTAKTETTFCLFTRPEVDIQTNDFLVITHFGKKIEAVAGFPECMKSHNNIPVKLDKETV